jgi:integrase
MPRRRSPPRLYLDTARGQWIIRDGTTSVRTSCPESNRAGAEKRLAEYLGKKHKPEIGSDPLIADILTVYSREHLQHKASAKNSAYNVGSLSKWWASTKLSDVTADNCRAYGEGRTPAAARRDLEVLRAAIRYWNKEKARLPYLPTVVLPPKPEPRERWLTRREAATFLWSARRTEHLGRFILLGLYTGSRSAPIRKLRWDWIDFEAGTMRRRAPRANESKNKKAPIVRLGRRILAHLRRWRRLDGPNAVYVCHYDGRAFGKIKGSWDKAVRRAKLSDDGGRVTPHVLRHTRATWLMQRGIDPWEAAGHLGMSVETLIRNYGHHHPDYQRRAAEV